MINNRQKALQQAVLLCGVAVLIFGGHLLYRKLQGQPLWQHKIVAAYAVNAIIASAIVAGTLLAPKKFSTSLGYLFLAGSAVKFTVFFAFFMPAYKADGQLLRAEFFTFFIPYIICLVAETALLVRHFNNKPVV